MPNNTRFHQTSCEHPDFTYSSEIKVNTLEHRGACKRSRYIPCPVSHKNPLAEACSNSVFWQGIHQPQHETILPPTVSNSFTTYFPTSAIKKADVLQTIASLQPQCVPTTQFILFKREDEVLCNRYLKSIVQRTQNNQATSNSEVSSLIHLILTSTWNLKYHFFP